MEKQLNIKFGDFLANFKNEIITEIKKYESSEINLADTISFIYNYNTFTIEKSDLHKRRRVKNTVPFHDRCKAMRANNEQCTRRKRDGCKFCGTHIKGTPHGEINNIEQQDTCQPVKIQIWAEEIAGIIYHLDKSGNIYDPQDIYENKKNPKVISHYVKEGDKYNIIN